MQFLLDNKDGLSPAKVEDLIVRHIQSHPDWKSVLLLPPDITRFHSGAGPITAYSDRARGERPGHAGAGDARSHDPG